MKRSAIEALWLKNPGLTQKDIKRLTGASHATIRHVYRQLIARRALAKKPGTWFATDAMA